MQRDLEIDKIVPDDDDPFVLRFFLSRPVSDKERDTLTLHGIQLDPRSHGTGDDGLALENLPNSILRVEATRVVDAEAGSPQRGTFVKGPLKIRGAQPSACA